MKGSEDMKKKVVSKIVKIKRVGMPMEDLFYLHQWMLKSARAAGKKAKKDEFSHGLSHGFGESANALLKLIDLQLKVERVVK